MEQLNKVQVGIKKGEMFVICSNQDVGRSVVREQLKKIKEHKENT